MLKPTLLIILCGILPFGIHAQQTTTLAINAASKEQTVDGFGAAIAYFENWLVSHPNKAEVYDLIFRDLNLGILRLRNTHNNTSTNYIPDMQEIVTQANTSLGHPVDILLSSWSPPSSLKANGILNGGTLLKTNGQFVYDDFAQWWYDGIVEYTQAGLVPTYISMQNEPDYENTGWETCIFKNVQSSSYPGYGVALAALYNKLQTLPNRPKILGPEVAGIGYNNIPNYVDNLNKNYLDGYAYHLYNGGDNNNPDSFNQNLNTIKNSYGDKPNIMTEYSGGSWFSTAWLIHNCLSQANASGYLYWDLIWGRPYGTGGLVSLESPWESGSWSTARGYVINGDYYAVKHFTKSISKGYVRVAASATSGNIKATAFLNPAEDKAVVVLLNVSYNTESTSIAWNGFTANSVTGYQSVENNYYYSLDALTPGGALTLPARSVTTLEFSRGTRVAVTGVTVNPASATIDAGTTVQLTADVLPENATNKAVTWSSSNTGIATVNSAGLVTGVAAGSVTITAQTVDSNKTATCAITVNSNPNSCNYGTPTATSFPSLSASFNKVYVLGTGGPVLSNVTNFTINWNLSLNGLWQLSFNTSNGQPNWWIDLRNVSTWKLNAPQPDITFTNSGLPGLDGSYWMSMDGSNVVMVSKNGGFTLYFSNSNTAPSCSPTSTTIAASGDAILYPNPFTNSITIKTDPSRELTSLNVVDQYGVVKKVDKFQLDNRELHIGSDLTPGIYMILITDKQGTKSYRVLKK